MHGICIALPNSASSTDNDNADDSDKINFKENPGHQTGCGRHLPVPGVRTPQRDETGGRGRTGRGWGVVGGEGETTAFLTARGNQGGGSLKADWLCKRGVCYA